jgi:hypothetical protein
MIRVLAYLLVSFWMTTASAATIDDLVQVDALGYQCIADEDLERAWELGSKGARLPQTCIPDPCAETLTDQLLSTVLGYQPSQSEYMEYRGRLSNVCGTPSVWAERGFTDEELLAFFMGDGDGYPVGGGSKTPPPSVPLPATAYLLFAALMGLGAIRKWRAQR